MINVVIFAHLYDTGGQGYRIKKAFDRYQPGYAVRAIHTQESYFNYPYDLRRTDGRVPDLFKKSDVVHVRNDTAGVAHYLSDYGTRGLLVHHHGTIFREGHADLWPKFNALDAVQAASTLDLTMLEPSVWWLPSPYDLEELSRFRSPRPLDSKFRIAHAPTNRAVKSTGTLIAAVTELQRLGIPVVLDLMEKQTWSSVLVRKAKADIYVDQLTLGYGNNAVEAWGLGIPVVAGVRSPAVKDLMIKAWGRLPFYEATEATLVDRLVELYEDLELRKYWAEVGWQHVVEHHDDETVVQGLVSLYTEALRKGKQRSGQESEGQNA